MNNRKIKKEAMCVRERLEGIFIPIMMFQDSKKMNPLKALQMVSMEETVEVRKYHCPPRKPILQNR